MKLLRSQMNIHETTRYIIGDALQPETNDILMRLPPCRIQETEISPYQNDMLISLVGNRELISCFRNASIWFGDGTFGVVHEMYSNTVHNKIGNNYPPCVYFLLPNKTQETYRRMFDILRDLVPNSDPDIILLDFELAARNAFKDIFPRTEADGCFSICVFSKCASEVGKLGFKKSVRDRC